MDTLADFIKYKNSPSSGMPISFENSTGIRRIKFAPNSFKSFLRNSHKKVIDASISVAKKLEEKSEKKFDIQVDDVSMAATAYANYDASKISLQNSITKLQMINVKLTVYDFAIKRLESLASAKQAKLNGSFAKRIKDTFSEFKKSIKNVTTNNSEMRQGIFTAIKERKDEETVRDTANKMPTIDTTKENMQKATPEDSISKSQPYGMTDEDMKRLTEMFNGLSDGSLDVQDGELKPVLKEEKQKVENASQPGAGSFVKPSDIIMDEVMDLKVQNSELRTRNNGLNDKNLQLNQELVSAKNRIAALEGQLGQSSDLDQKNRNLESQLLDSRAQIAGLSNQISDLERRNKDSFARAQVAEEQLRRAKADFEAERQQMRATMEARIRSGIEIAMQQVMGASYGDSVTSESTQKNGNRTM